MNSHFFTFASFLAWMLPLSLLQAAIAPKSPEQLNSLASLIAIGTVESADVSVSGNPMQSRWNLNLVVKVESIEKGNGTIEIKPGDSIKTYLWSSRRMSAPGHQGMDVVPAEGARAKFWLTKNSDGVWEPLYPNGIELLEGQTRYDFAAYERHRAKDLVFRIGIPVLVISATAIIFLVRRSGKRRTRNE